MPKHHKLCAACRPQNINLKVQLGIVMLIDGCQAKVNQIFLSLSNKKRLARDEW